MTPQIVIDDELRTYWVEKYRLLWKVYRRTGLSKPEFVKQYRDEIDEIIRKRSGQLAGVEPNQND